ncbi:hypothetical protein ACTWP5_18565 [Streptomyces sp. 4N509B]|uniref:hypothetical protein n=1 Tax=Streptomyces sp. 4N509B TaxID=3457413 RepID=UPI003FD0EEA6
MAETHLHGGGERDGAAPDGRGLRRGRSDGPSRRDADRTERGGAVGEEARGRG